MSRIDQMIKELCPEGVEKVPFLECATLTRGITYNKTQEANQGQDSYKVLRANNITLGLNCLNFDDVKEVVKEVKIKPEQWLKKDDILICAGSGSKEHVGKVAYIYQDINYCFGGFMGVIRPKNGVLNRYLFHCLIGNTFSEYLNSALNSTTINNLNNQVMSGYEIPLPPLSIQQEIVSVLDSFTTLIDKMKQEVEKRKKQMEYYRDMLICEQGFPKRAIGEIGTIKRGSGLQKTDFTEKGTGCIHYGQIYTRLNSFCTETLTFVPTELAKRLTTVSPGDLVIATTSENVEDVCKSVVWLGKKDICTGGHAAVFKHNENPKYISYCFQTGDFFLQKIQYAYGAKVIDIKTEKLSAITLPIPSISKQQEIVSILDKFESYITKLEKMIALRQKQYEYYREQLLTFE